MANQPRPESERKAGTEESKAENKKAEKVQKKKITWVKVKVNPNPEVCGYG